MGVFGVKKIFLLSMSLQFFFVVFGVDYLSLKLIVYFLCCEGE